MYDVKKGNFSWVSLVLTSDERSEVIVDDLREVKMKK